MSNGASLKQPQAEPPQADEHVPPPVAGLLESLPVEAFLIDPMDGSLIAGNEAAHGGLGYDRAEFAHLRLADLDLSGSRDELTSLARGVRRGTPMRFAARLRRRDGRPCDRVVTFSFVESAGRAAVLAACYDTSEQKKAEAALREQRRRGYRASEEVRRQIARDLHDGVGQDLTGLLLGLSALEDSLANDDDRAACHELVELAAGVGAKLQRIAWEQQPTSLDDFGLLRALESYAAEWAERNGVTLDVHGGSLGGARLAPDIEIIAYRVVQTLLVDLARNNRTRLASLVLERRGDELQIIFEHDGHDDSAATDDADEGDERLSFVGGTLSVEAGCGLGTTIYVRIPLAGEPRP